LLRIKSGSDNYGDRSIQTFNYDPKPKNLETTKVNTIEKETFAAEWDILDTQQEKQMNFFEQTQLEMYFSFTIIVYSIYSKKTLDEEMQHNLKNDFSMLPLSLDSIKHWISETQNQIEYKREIRDKSSRDIDSNKDTTTG